MLILYVDIIAIFKISGKDSLEHRLCDSTTFVVSGSLSNTVFEDIHVNEQSISVWTEDR